MLCNTQLKCQSSGRSLLRWPGECQPDITHGGQGQKGSANLSMRNKGSKSWRRKNHELLQQQWDAARFTVCRQKHLPRHVSEMTHGQAAATLTEQNFLSWRLLGLVHRGPDLPAAEYNSPVERPPRLQGVHMQQQAPRLWLFQASELQLWCKEGPAKLFNSPWEHLQPEMRWPKIF